MAMDGKHGFRDVALPLLGAGLGFLFVLLAFLL